MPADADPSPDSGDPDGSGHRWRVRLATVLVVALIGLVQVPAVSAHGQSGTTVLTQTHGVIGMVLGIALVGGAVLGKRRDWIAPTPALYVILVGLALTVLGAIVFEGLGGDPTYSASSMPFPRSWYQPMSLLLGMGIVLASFLVGWLRFPTRPRYTFLGIAIGLWIAYPSLLPGFASSTHPLGYAIVLGTPVLVGYVLWKDAWPAISVALRDTVARRFGIGVGTILAVYFATVSGYLSVFPDEAAPHRRVIAVVDVQYQLVVWRTVEIYLPHVPLFVAFSVGMLVLVGLLAALVGINAALIAHQWRIGERATAGTIESTAGTGALVGSCACSCCGPMVAQIAVLVAGPSVAAPLYWVFVDSASPFTLLFLVASIGLFTASLVYSTETENWAGGSTVGAPAD